MILRRHRLAPWLFAPPLACACACAEPDGPTPLEERAEAAMLTNGVALNGVALNGVALNGVALNGVALNGVALKGVALNGVALKGVASDGTHYGGAELVGAKLLGLLAGGGTLPLLVDAARTAGGLWFYKISYETASGRRELCGLDASGAAVEALALEGRWNNHQGVPSGGSWINDPSAFTFGCRGAALAKCVELGYKPWASAGGVPLRDHHQACTRMVRADYCGDGRPWTVDGTPVNTYDKVGVQADAKPWPIEAEWTASGARFISISTQQRFLHSIGLPPGCFLLRVSPFAGVPQHFATGTLLMSENHPGLPPFLGLLSTSAGPSVTPA